MSIDWDAPPRRPAQYADPQLGCYERLLQQSVAPFAEIKGPDDFHLTVFHLASFRTEVIFDLDCREGRCLFCRTYFRSPLWDALFHADHDEKILQPVAMKRIEAELPADNRLVRLVRDGLVHRMRNGRRGMLDGVSYSLVLTQTDGCRRLRSSMPPGSR